MSNPKVTERMKFENIAGIAFEGTYYKCQFIGSASNASFVRATLIECDLTQVDFKNCLFKFSCSQSSKSKLSVKQFAMFVYWISECFELPAVCDWLVNACIGQYKTELKDYFNQE